jgi:hypothetical protein
MASCKSAIQYTPAKSYNIYLCFPPFPSIRCPVVSTPGSYRRPSQYDVSSTNSSLQCVEQPQDPELCNLCDRIKIQSAPHTSFPIISMAATVSFGVMCILCSYAIRPLFTWTHCCARHGTYKTKEWTGSSTFQSQRVAAEGKGIGPWKGKEGDMPTLMEPEFWFS